MSPKERFVTALVAMAELYGRPLSEHAIAMYWRTLQQYDIDAIEAALDRHAANPDTGQFFPKPADIVRYIDGGTEDAALLAWSRVERAIRHVGPYQTVAFDDHRIHHCLSEMGGWVQLCSVTEDELPFRRNEFVKRYRGATQREVNYPPTLIGIAQATNEAENVEHKQDVILIGDPKKAGEVMQSGQVQTLEYQSASMMTKGLTDDSRTNKQTVVSRK